jgi:hypothetical protein
MAPLGRMDERRVIKLSARLAIGFAVFLAFAEVARNWGSWGYWAWWVVDYIAVALLLYGGWLTLRSGARTGLPALAGGWGFACAMFYASFFSHLENISRPDHGPFDQLPLTIVIGMLFVVTLAALVLTLAAAHRSARTKIGDAP